MLESLIQKIFVIATKFQFGLRLIFVSVARPQFCWQSTCWLVPCTIISDSKSERGGVYHSGSSIHGTPKYGVCVRHRSKSKNFLMEIFGLAIITGYTGTTSVSSTCVLAIAKKYFYMVAMKKYSVL